MPTAFQTDKNGRAIVVADPSSDLDYSISSWLEAAVFTAAAWTITPNVPGALHDPGINASPVVVDGVSYAAGMLATTWIDASLLAIGTEYRVNLHGTFTAGREDDRSFIVRLKEK